MHKKVNDFIIKVCGIRTLEEALGCLDAGADTLGFLVGLTHVAEDKVSADTAKSIVSAIDGRARSVMVTHLLDPQTVASLAKGIGVSAIQIHDDMTFENIIRLRLIAPELILIKAVHVTGAEAVEKAKSYEVCVDFLLLDSRTNDRLGGTGKIHDWNISRHIVAQSALPVILAGGLTPDNIGFAIEKVRPAGIDANSGLEDKEGRKDFQKVAAFVKAGLNRAD